MRVAVANLSDITLHQTAFQVFAVRVRCVVQIVAERDKSDMLTCQHFTALAIRRQNSSLTPSCTWRGSRTVVTRPKALLLEFVFTLAKFV